MKKIRQQPNKSKQSKQSKQSNKSSIPLRKTGVFLRGIPVFEKSGTLAVAYSEQLCANNARSQVSTRNLM
jgi:hypothetical protein